MPRRHPCDRVAGGGCGQHHDPVDEFQVGARCLQREIEFLRSLGDFPGVLPVIEAYLPDNPSRQDRPWLAMPIATPISVALADASLDDVVRAVAVLASTLTRLAEEHQVGHRDIKPGNLYELDGGFLVGDFGLIDVPDLDELTRSGKPLGPARDDGGEASRPLLIAG